MATDNKITSYYLSDPLIWLANKELIENTILDAMDVNKFWGIHDCIDFNIDYVSGQIHCFLTHDLWSDQGKSGIEDVTEADVRMIATSFIQKLQVSSANQQFKKECPVPILPTSGINFNIMDVNAIPHYSADRIDHWLCRGYISVSAVSAPITTTAVDGTVTTLVDTGYVPVMGSDIEIRIGGKKKVVGFKSAWRPTDMSGHDVVFAQLDQAAFDAAGDSATPATAQATDGSATTDGTSGAADSADGSSGSTGSDGTTPPAILPQLVYLLDGAGTPRTGFLPYYLKQDDDDSYFFPASEESLVVDIMQQSDGTSGADVLALASGGSGDYVYQWSSYTHADFFDTGVQLLTESGQTAYDGHSSTVATSTISLPSGVHNVIVLAIDNQTGVMKQKQQTIYTGLVCSYSQGTAPDVAITENAIDDISTPSLAATDPASATTGTGSTQPTPGTDGTPPTSTPSTPDLV